MRTQTYVLMSLVPDRRKKRPRRQRVICAECKRENFQLNYFSNDSSFIRWENGERLRLRPDFNSHPFGHCVMFFGQESQPPPPFKSGGARTPMSISISLTISIKEAYALVKRATT